MLQSDLARTSRYGFHGPTALISDACSSGIDAVEQAYQTIVDGICDVASAGGTDARRLRRSGSAATACWAQ